MSLPVQLKPEVSAAGDRFESEADEVADRVTSQAAPGRVDAGSGAIAPGSSHGNALASPVREEMGRRFGVDFGNVRVHTDEVAVALSERFGARAFTYGSDIFFNHAEYDPASTRGGRLLAHELAHVVQQSGSAHPRLVQRTTIGEILDEFFSPFSDETLWVMPASDNYTRIVRRWRPVIEAVNQAKADLEANCATWQTAHATDPSWSPGMTDPPVTDPNAHGIWVSSPPGTDPDTCRRAFIVYVTSKAAGLIPSLGGMRPVQTFELYTCSIGSFGIYATVDSIDCAAKTAEMNIWMYNAMDRDSFGRFAGHPAFSLSGMERQYMWWNWTESHAWGAPTGGTSPTPGAPSEW